LKTLLSVPDVRDSIGRVVKNAAHVRIDLRVVEAFASRHVQFLSAPIEVVSPFTFRGSREQCANFVLLTDALNFCFWSDTPWQVEYRGRTWTRTQAAEAGLHRAIESDPTWLDANRWAHVTDEDIAGIFAGTGEIPLLARRVSVMRETGRVLSEQFGGQCCNLVESVGGSAVQLARALAARFPSFRDVASYRGQPVALLKRAQIMAADLHRAWLDGGWGGLTDMDELTVFADYRLPQLFRHEQMLILDNALAVRIDRGELIESGSPEEVELRAATIRIGDLIYEALADTGVEVPVWRLDYQLWKLARRPDVTTPHHRTITHYY